MSKIFLFLAATLTVYTVCGQPKNKDLLVVNATIYTVDARFSKASAMIVRAGKILETGTSANLRARYPDAEIEDAGGRFIYPGFIDAHTHFYRYGLGLHTVDLTGTNSWDEVIARLAAYARNNPSGWIIGRGWDQNDWPVKEFPTRSKLDSAFGNRPVVLTRIDGHAVIVNKQVLDMAGIHPGQTLSGGSIETRNSQLTGILIDNATGLAYAQIPQPTNEQSVAALQQAEANCFAVGLTTVDDCGLDYETVELIDKLQKDGRLKMRIYALLSDATKNYNYLFARGAIKTPRLHVCSFKVYADGALGSRGACLLAPYNDRPDWTGFLLSSQKHFDSVAAIIAQHGFQMCTHAIGDSANRIILQIYGRHLKTANDRRWRIEHAQVISPADFALFKQFNIIPSVQPTHATSDMYWAADRLGQQRVKGAYAYKQLLGTNGWIPLGTDFPVEDISPLKTFYAAVFRMDAKGFPQGGFQPENALTREQALRGMTIWAAKANFEEQEKGSLEKGKWADFVILDKDLMTAQPQEVLNARVIATYSNGEKVFDNNN